VEFDAERELAELDLTALSPLDNLLSPGSDGRLHLGPRHLGVVFDALKRLKLESAQPRLGQELLLSAMFYELLVVLARAVAAGDEDPERYRGRLAATLAYMSDHFREVVTLEQLAENARMPESRFLQLFRHAYGTTPLEYLASLRMREARELLRDETRSISEVAFDVGYHDSDYFSRAFKEHHGLTPRDFRQLARIGLPGQTQRDDAPLSTLPPPPRKPARKPRGSAQPRV
jgi:AraC family L-rhamnose operon transcriptional activator RhaR/AraC family L-rhamnose operon regulatory protein RhaS